MFVHTHTAYTSNRRLFSELGQVAFVAPQDELYTAAGCIPGREVLVPTLVR